MTIAIIILAIISLVIYFLVSFAKKKQRQAEDMVDWLYKMLAMEDESERSKLANAGILYALIDVLFLDVPNVYSAIKRMQVYIAFTRKNGFSEEELSHIKTYLFNSTRIEKKLSPKATSYKYFIGELSKSVSLFVEDCKNGNPLLESISVSEARNKSIKDDTNMKIFLFLSEIKAVLQEFLGRKEFPEKFSDISN